MNKIKRGVSLLLCSLLFGSAVTLGNVADVHPVHNAVEYIDACKGIPVEDHDKDRDKTNNK